MALVECNKSLLSSLAEKLHIYDNSQSITLQLRHEEQAEANLAATSTKAAAAATLGDALSITVLTKPDRLR
jgi:hypothetical protein